MLGGIKLQLIFAVGEGLMSGPLLDVVPCIFLILGMFAKETGLCQEMSWLVVSGTVFFWAGSGVSLFHVGSCGAPDGDGHLFWQCTNPPLVEIRENPEFHDLMKMDKAHLPRFLL